MKSLILAVADRKLIGEEKIPENALATVKINQNFKRKRFQGSVPKKFFSCGKPGHLAKDCWHNSQNQKGRGRERNHNFNSGASNKIETLIVSEYALSAEISKQGHWVIDSGATLYISSSNSEMNEYVKFSNAKKIYLANNKEIEAKGYGDILVKCKLPNNESKTVNFQILFHVPEIKRDLISVPAITVNGGSVKLLESKCEMVTQRGLAATGHREENIFVLDAESKIKTSIANVALSTSKPSLKL